MASVLDVVRATNAPAAPAADAELVGPPAPPKRTVADIVNAPPPKRTVVDVVNAHQAAQELQPGAAAGGMIGGVARREEERAQIPELLRRPEEEEPPVAPRPDEAPPLLRRPAYEEAPAGAYGKPTRLEKAALYGTRMGVPIVAGVGAGALAGPGAPVVGPLAGASAATATELGLQKYETARGLRKEVSPGGVVLQGVLGGFQGLPLPTTLAAPVRFGARTLEGAGVGTGATTLGTLIEEKRLPTKEELAWGAATGAAFGAVGGGIETKGIPYLHERSAEFVGPREGGVMSRRQLRATEQARVTSADQLAGETTAPPVGEPEPRMVTRPGETIGGEPGEFVGPPAPEPAAAPAGRVSPVYRYDDVTGMSADDLEAAHADQRAYEQGATVDVFGPEGAKRYEQLQRTANSTIAPHETTRAASDEIARMESGLTPAQEQRLFGIGEEGYNADDLRRIARAARDYHPANVADMPDADLLNTAGRELLSGNLKDDPVAVIRLHGALRELGNRGYDKSVIQDAVVRRAAREGVSPGDAQELLDANLRDLQTRQARPTPEAAALPAPVRALPAPEPAPVVGPPEPPAPAGGEPAPPPGGEAPGAGRPWEAPPEETGPYGQRPTFRKSPGLGEALTGEEIEPQRAADPARMTRAIEAIDREFGDVFDEPTRERLKQQIRDNQARFEYLGRGTQTVERTKGLARDLIFDLDAAKVEPKGTTWNPEQTQAAKNHVVALDQTIQDARAAYDADPTPENGLLLQKAAQDQVDAFTILRARGAEAGRTVNIFKASAEELASGNQRLLTAALRRGVPPDRLAEIIRNTEPRDVQARAEMLMELSRKGPWHSRLMDTMQSFFISNLLSGFGPHERNLLGNSVRAVATPATRPFSAAIERYISRVPAGERQIYAGQGAKEYAAVKDSLWEASVKALEVLRRGYTSEQAAKFDLPTQEIGQGMHPNIRMGLNIIPRLLSAPDMFFRVLAQHASENGQAYTKARNEAMVEAAGKQLPQGMTFADRLDQLYDYHRANKTPEMIETAGNDAAISVYQEHSNMARILQQVRRDYPPVGFVIPFTTTATNIAKQQLHHTPFGFLMPSTWGKGMEGGVRARQALTHQGEALMGTTMTALAPLAVYAAGGKMHGHGPDDPKEFAVWRQTHTPNSIEIGGHAVDISWLGPLAGPLLLVGNAWDEYDNIQQKQGHVSPADADRIAGKAIAGSMQSMLDMPYLEGVSNLIDLIRHPESRSWHKFADSIGLGFVPGIGFQRWLEQIEDPTLREAKTFGEKVQAATPDIPGTDIPTMPFGRSVDLPPRLDEYGQPIEIKKPLGGFGRAVIPFAVEPVRRDPLRDELAKFGMTLSPPGAGTPEKGEPPYTPKEGLVIRQAKGQQVRAELEDLIASDAYQEAEPEDQLTMLKSVLGKTRGAIGKAARGLREEGLDVESLRW